MPTSLSVGAAVLFEGDGSRHEGEYIMIDTTRLEHAPLCDHLFINWFHRIANMWFIGQDYDAQFLAEMAAIPNAIVIFCLATYGEGEPTDNAREFHDWLKEADR